MGKRKAFKPQPADHPMIAAGFLHESHVRRCWPIGNDTYFREWLRKNEVPNRVIGGERWFHRDALVAWFGAGPDKAKEGCK